MTDDEVLQQLDSLVASDEFAFRSQQLVDGWRTAGAGLEKVTPILRFMEDNPALDFGTPGALVHFVEQFYRKGYEDLLCESIRRKPTDHTVWMLNRLINGADEDDEREALVVLMKEARDHPLADKAAVASAQFFLAHL